MSEISFSKSSADVLQLKSFLGILFMYSSALFIVLSDTCDMGLPFGIKNRTKPFCRSFVPLSHELYGWAKYTGTPISDRFANSEPLSAVMLLKT